MSEYQVFKNIQKHIRLSDVDKQSLSSYLILKDIKRKTLILNQGQLCRNLFFVETGSLRAYYVDDEGKDSTIMFAVKDWWITDMNSFVHQTPALLSIEALEDSSIIEFNYSLLEKLYIEIPQFERLFRILFQKAYIREQTRALHSIAFSTKERYIEFVKNFPAIVEKVTQKQIASYLGVTPEFLSSVKKNMDS